MTKIFKRPEISRWRNIIFFVFLIFYAFILIYLAQDLNLWVDESYTMHTTSNNLWNVIQQSYYFEGQPPLYFILLSIWRHIYPGIFFARLFSLLFVGLAAYVFYKLVFLVSASECSRWLIVIFLLNPFTVWAGLEIRLYAFLLFLSTISIYFFFQFYTKNKNWYLYLFLISCIIGLYTQYFFLFLIVSLVFSSGLFKGWKYFFKLCLYLLPVFLLFLPNLLFISDQLYLSQTQKSKFLFLERFFFVLYSPQNLILALHMLPIDRIFRWGIKIIFFLFFIYTCFKWYKSNKGLMDPYIERIKILLISVSVLVFLLSFSIAITEIDHEDRYLTIAFPIFILVLTLFKVFTYSKRNLIFGTISIYFTLILLYSYTYPVKVKWQDYKGVANYVSKIEKKGEPIMFYHSGLTLTFLHYYTGINPIIPLPKQIIFDSYYTELTVNIKDTSELKHCIEQINTDSKSYLLISDFTGPLYIHDINKKMVDDYLSSHYNITLDTLYYGVSKFHALRIKRLENKIGK